MKWAAAIFLAAFLVISFLLHQADDKVLRAVGVQEETQEEEVRDEKKASQDEETIKVDKKKEKEKEKEEKEKEEKEREEREQKEKEEKDRKEKEKEEKEKAEKEEKEREKEEEEAAAEEEEDKEEDNKKEDKEDDEDSSKKEEEEDADKEDSASDQKEKDQDQEAEYEEEEDITPENLDIEEEEEEEAEEKKSSKKKSSKSKKKDSGKEAEPEEAVEPAEETDSPGQSVWFMTDEDEEEEESIGELVKDEEEEAQEPGQQEDAEQADDLEDENEKDASSDSGKSRKKNTEDKDSEDKEKSEDPDEDSDEQEEEEETSAFFFIDLGEDEETETESPYEQETSNVSASEETAESSDTPENAESAQTPESSGIPETMQEPETSETAETPDTSMVPETESGSGQEVQDETAAETETETAADPGLEGRDTQNKQRVAADAEDGTRISVYDPEGEFPSGTKISIRKMDEDTYRDAIAEVMDEGTVLTSACGYDLSLRSAKEAAIDENADADADADETDSTSKEKADDHLMQVTIKPGDSIDGDRIAVYWIDENGSAQKIMDAASTSAISFNAADLSTYVIAGISDIRRKAGPTLRVGEIDVLEIPAGYSENGRVRWKSSRPSVVKVDQDGTITAQQIGTSILMWSVTGENISAGGSFTVEVLPQSSQPGIRIRQESLTLTSGHSRTLDMKARGMDEGQGNITWISSDSEVVTVENGTIKALRPGNAIITASIDPQAEGGKSNGNTAPCSACVKVTVK